MRTSMHGPGCAPQVSRVDFSKFAFAFFCAFQRSIEAWSDTNLGLNSIRSRERLMQPMFGNE